MEAFVVDTMAIVLWMEKRKLPQKVKTIFFEAEKSTVSLYVPAMVLVEIGYLSEKGRIQTTLYEVFSYLDKHVSIIMHETNSDIIKTAFQITDIPELHDRIIAASGRLLNLPVITNDPKIIASEFVETLWQ